MQVAFRCRPRYDAAMHPLAPFTPGTERPYCPLAWQGPVCFETDWRAYSALQAVPASGFYALLRRAQLPRAELAHMGAPRAVLDGTAGAWVGQEVAAPLLGRIVLDAHEVVWDKSMAPTAAALGRAIIAAVFR